MVHVLVEIIGDKKHLLLPHHSRDDFVLVEIMGDAITLALLGLNW